MSRMRRKASGNNVVLMTKLDHFRGLVRAIPITDEDSRAAIGPIFGLGIKHFTIPVQDGPTVAVSTLGACKCQPGVSWMVQSLRSVEAGQMMSGSRLLLSAEMHSTAVIWMRLALGPFTSPLSSLWTMYFRDLETLILVPVSSKLYTFSGKRVGS